MELLRSNGIYPDRFYTDFKRFKSDSKVFRNAIVVVIFQGGRHFPKMQVVMFLRGLLARKDGGVNRALIFADENPRIAGGYYQYRGDLFKVDLMDGFDVVEKGSNIWGRLKGPVVDTDVILSKFDLGDISKLRDEYEARDQTRDKHLSLVRAVKVEKVL